MKRTVSLVALVGAISMLLVASTLSQNRAPSGSRGRWAARQGGVSGRAYGGFGADAAQLHTQHREEFQRRMEEMRRRAEQDKNRSIRRALDATDQQWRLIQPKLQSIERLKAEADVAVAPGSFGWGPGRAGGGAAFGGGFSGGGGWAGGFGSSGGGFSGGPAGQPGRSWSHYESWGSGPPSAYKPADALTEGDLLCEELLRLLQDPSAPAAEITAKAEALRTARRQAADRLADARKQLREIVMPRQAAALVLMGYLD